MTLKLIKEKFIKKWDTFWLFIWAQLIKLFLYSLKLISKNGQRTRAAIIQALNYNIYSDNDFDLPTVNYKNDILVNQVLKIIINDELAQRIIQSKPEELSEVETQALKQLNSPKTLRLISHLYLAHAIENRALAVAVKKMADLYSSSEELKKLVDDKESLSIKNVEKARYYGTEPLPIVEYSSLKLLRTDALSESNKLHEQIADKSALKIHFDLKAISTIFGLSSGVLLLGGYIYNRIFLGHFGIDATKFFSISDYLTSSLDTVIWAAVSAIVPLVMILMRLSERSRMPSTIQLIEQDKKGELIWDIFLYTAIGAVAFWSWLVFYKSMPWIGFFYDSILLLIVTLVGKFLPGLCGRYFKDPLFSFFTFTFIILFVSSVSISAFKTSERFEKNEYGFFNNKKVTIKATGIKDEDLSDYRVIQANSSYYFFLSKDNKKILIYPTKDIELLNVEDKLN